MIIFELMPDSSVGSRLAAAFVIVLALSGCAGSRPELTPVATPPSPPQTSTDAMDSDPSPTGPSYDAAKLDLCARTDLDHIADLAVTVTGTNPGPFMGNPDAACLFEMRTETERPVSLKVEVYTPVSADQARLRYQATQQVTVMTPVGAIAGLGDEAEAFYKKSAPGTEYKYTEYLVHSRTGNLVVEVWISVGDDSYLPMSTLAPKALAILTDTQAAVPEV